MVNTLKVVGTLAFRIKIMLPTYASANDLDVPPLPPPHDYYNMIHSHYI